MTAPIDNQKPEIENENTTGLPLLTTWPAVYAFVLAFFIVLVFFLTFFTALFTRAAK